MVISVSCVCIDVVLTKCQLLDIHCVVVLFDQPLSFAMFFIG